VLEQQQRLERARYGWIAGGRRDARRGIPLRQAGVLRLLSRKRHRRQGHRLPPLFRPGREGGPEAERIERLDQGRRVEGRREALQHQAGVERPAVVAGEAAEQPDGRLRLDPPLRMGRRPRPGADESREECCAPVHAIEQEVAFPGLFHVSFSLDIDQKS